MYQQISGLILYKDQEKESILYQIAEIIYCYQTDKATKEMTISNLYGEVHKLLKIATDYGFDHNLWQNYLTFYMITHENPFSITCEKEGAKKDGSVNLFAVNDFSIFYQLFHYDFTKLEEQLGISCFSILTDYHAIGKKELMYNHNVSEKVQSLSQQLNYANNGEEFFERITEFYRQYGVGMFGLNKAFRIDKNEAGQVEFLPINNMEQVALSDLIGYEIQKKKLIDNTKAFVEGKKANNTLLYGDSGTGKSTSIKAIVNEYYPMGLRMIEIYKHQFQDLSAVIAAIKNRNYRFIIYMDDLSFEEFETEYKFLKAVIEGGVETRPDNILIYATSNRRHLIKETWNDRNDVEVKNGMHRSDTMEEKLSLFNRFGCQINYSKPSQKEYFEIVLALAKKANISMSEEELKQKANQWELSHGGISGRSAQQFINDCLGKE